MVSILGPEHINEVLDCLKSVENDFNNYKSLLLEKQIMSKLLNSYILRHEMFNNYKIFLSIEDKNKSLICLSQEPRNIYSNYVVIEYMKNIDIISKKWEEINDFIYNLTSGKNKIIINACKDHSIDGFLHKKGFTLETELNSEFEHNDKIQVYSLIGGEKNGA